MIVNRLLLLLTLTSSIPFLASAAPTKGATNAGKIHLFYDTNFDPVDVDATNNNVASTIDLQNGNLNFSLKMQQFKFDVSLMEKHFNEKYFDTKKYPDAVFTGTVQNAGKINWSAPGAKTVTVKGMLTMRGITQPVTQTGTLTLQNGKLRATSKFKIAIADYKFTFSGPQSIAIPDDAKIDVDVDLTYDLQ